MSQKPGQDKDVDLPLDDAEIHQHQKFDHDDTGETPDFLATPKKGRGTPPKQAPADRGWCPDTSGRCRCHLYVFARQAAQLNPAAPLAPPKLSTTAAPPVRPSGNDYMPPSSDPVPPVPGVPSDAPAVNAGSVPTDSGAGNNANNGNQNRKCPRPCSAVCDRFSNLRTRN